MLAPIIPPITDETITITYINIVFSSSFPDEKNNIIKVISKDVGILQIRPEIIPLKLHNFDDRMPPANEPKAMQPIKYNNRLSGNSEDFDIISEKINDIIIEIITLITDETVTPITFFNGIDNSFFRFIGLLCIEKPLTFI